MRNSTIEFKGIVRATSGQVAGEGACEELINTRFESGHLRVVGKKKAIMSDTAFKKYILHKIGSVENHIAFYDNKVYQVNSTTLAVIQEIYTATGDIELSVLNNMLIINDLSAEKLVTYGFEEGAYSLLFNGLPALPTVSIALEDYSNPDNSLAWPVGVGTTEADLSGGLEKFAFGQVFSIDLDDYADEALFRDTVISAIKQTKTSIDGYNEGHILLSLNYSLLNGEETKMSNPILINLGRYEPRPFVYYGGTYDAKIILALQKAVVSLSDTPEYATYKGLIKSINIYATLPLSRYELDREKVAKFTHDGNRYDIKAPFAGFTEKTHKTEDFASLLFFKQYSVPLNNIEASYTLKFGLDQSEEKTLPIDNSGWLKTSGKMFVYNNRLHLFDYKRQFTNEAGIFSKLNCPGTIASPQEAKTINVSFLLQTGTSNLAVSGQVDAMIEILPDNSVKLWLSELVAFPDSRAIAMYVSFEIPDPITPTNTLVYQGKVILTPSKTYNYAYNYKPFSLTAPLLVCSVVGIGEGEVIPSSDYIEDKDVILVSSPGAPYHFPVEHSYRIGGEIQDLALMVEQLSEAQQGQYPVIVLTDRGIFALQQGQGIVLYSNLIPISNDVCRRGAVQTKSGVAYIANNSVNLLYGRRGVSISQVIESYLDRSIRFNNSFALATGNIELYNITEYLSQADFREYVKEAELFYDSVREEIIVSNLNYLYSYAFSLREKLWHKITEVFKENTGRYALRPSQAQQQPALSATGSITIPALVISDSFSFASQNKCTIANGDALIPSGQQLSFLVGTTRLSSYYTQATMPLYMCLETMLGIIPFIEISYNSVNKVITIYSSKSEYTGQTITYRNITSDTTITQTLAAFSEMVTIEKKGIDEVITTIVGATTINLTILESDSYLSIIQRLSAAILAANSSVTITTDLNKLYITTKATGTAQNSTVLTTTSSLYVIVSDTNFAGGRDAGLANTEDSAVDVVDLNDEEIEGTNIIHIQTRPAQLGTIGYKTILRAALRGLIKPSGRPFGAYLFASNDLTNWNYVCGAQIAQNIANLRLLRAKASYRYFILVSGGNVDINNDLVMLEMDVEDKFENKTR